MQHILCLESESQEEDNHYNLGCLRAVVELMFSLKSYQPYYYYDNITSHFKNSNSLPYLIVTSECALQLSYNQKYAVCLRGAEYVAFFRKLFNDARKNAGTAGKRGGAAILGVLIALPVAAVLIVLILRLTAFKDSAMLGHLSSVLLGVTCGTLFYIRKYKHTKKNSGLYTVITIVLVIMCLLYTTFGVLGLLGFLG